MKILLIFLEFQHFKKEMRYFVNTSIFALLKVMIYED